MKTPSRLISCLLASAAFATSGVAQTVLVEWHEQVVPGVCTLRFPVAGGWVVDARPPAPGAVGLVLRPETGPRAVVLVSGTDLKADPRLEKTSGIKRAVKAMGEARLRDSVETKLRLERVDGRAGSGFFYSLTDKRTDLAEGGFRYTTQGIIAVGPLRLAVTVLADRPESSAWRMTLDLLRTADCEPLAAK